MSKNIKPKLAKEVIQSLEAGVVPKKGLSHLLVGRNDEVKEIIKILDSVAEGNSDIRFWVGDFGSGKSFMLRTIENLAMHKNFVASTIDLSPGRRFNASDGKARALYQAIVDNISIKTAQNGKAIQAIFEEAINNTMQRVATEKGIGLKELFNKENSNLVKNEILNITTSFYSTGLSFEFGQAMNKYYEGLIINDSFLKTKALRWIRGDIRTKTEAKKELGINNIIDDDNWYSALKNLSELFNKLGYEGLVVNFDEAVNLYKIPRSNTRERNYEHILNMYNDFKTSEAPHLFVNFGATRNTVFDDYRGLSSYKALKTRLGNEDSMDSKLKNMNRTVLKMKPLSNEEIYTLLENITGIFNAANDTNIEVSLDDIHRYMEEQLNRPGADEFLTPRAVIKDYLEILDFLRQNEEYNASDIINIKYGEKAAAVEKDKDDTNDDLWDSLEVF